MTVPVVVVVEGNEDGREHAASSARAAIHDASVGRPPETRVNIFGIQDGTMRGSAPALDRGEGPEWRRLRNGLSGPVLPSSVPSFIPGGTGQAREQRPDWLEWPSRSTESPPQSC